MKRIFLVFALFLFGLCISETEGSIIYSQDFDNWETGPGWSTNVIDDWLQIGVFKSADRLYLGAFPRGQIVTLNLPYLPEYDKIVVSFDLYIVGLWGNNEAKDFWGQPAGTNEWSLCANGTDLFSAAFRNIGRRDFARTEGDLNTVCVLRDIDILEFWYGSARMDTHYRIVSAFPYQSEQLSLQFGADHGTFNPCIENWGIDNLTISGQIVPEPSGMMAMIPMTGILLVHIGRSKCRRQK